LKFEFSRPAPRAVPRARPAGRGPPSLRRARASPVIPGAQACSTRPRTCSRRPCSATARRLDDPARACSGGGGGVWRARARASDCTDTSFAPAGTEWKDDASAEDEGRSRKHLSARGAATPPDGFGATSMVEASLAGRGSRGASRPSTGATCPSRGVRERFPGTVDARARPTRRVAALEPPLAQDVADRRRGRPRDAPARRGDGHPGPVRGAPRRARDRHGTVGAPTAAASPRAVADPVRRAPAQDGHGPRLARGARPAPRAPRRAPRAAEAPEAAEATTARASPRRRTRTSSRASSTARRRSSARASRACSGPSPRVL